MTNIAHTQNCGSFKRFIAARQEGFIKYFTTTWISLCLLQQLIVLQYESCICVLSDISNNKCGSSGKSLRFRKFFTENKPEILWYLDWEISLKSWEYIAERHHEWTQRGCLGKGVRHACIQSDCDPCDVWWRGTSSCLYNNLKVSNYLSPPWGMLMLSSWRKNLTCSLKSVSTRVTNIGHATRRWSRRKGIATNLQFYSGFPPTRCKWSGPRATKENIILAYN